MKKIKGISLNTLPVLLMILLIPFVLNDYVLTVLYIAIISAALFIHREKNDFTILIFGFFIMIISEYIFTSTGVETFNRNSLFGLMPIWLPFLLSYVFVAIKRSVLILDN